MAAFRAAPPIGGLRHSGSTAFPPTRGASSIRRRALWLDNSLFTRTPSTGVIGADMVHPGGISGARHIGYRLADEVVAALATLV